MKDGRGEFIIRIFVSTPWWVWGIFVYLLFIGIKATQRNIVSLPKLFIIPLALMGMKLQGFTEDFIILGTYFLGFFMGIGAGFTLGSKVPIKILRDIKSVELPGTYQTLFLLMTFFMIQYFFGFLKSVNPPLAVSYKPFEMGLTAFFSGFLLGKALAYLRKFLKPSAL